ncbi:hypothetical protein PFISCL1PPCAC_3571, partial [Pristionchus fissidentatus]
AGGAWPSIGPRFANIAPSMPLPTTLSTASTCNQLFDAIGKKRRSRKLYTQAQTDELERQYRLNPYVSQKEDRLRISKITGIAEGKVKIWFQNRRYKGKHQGFGESSGSEKSEKEEADVK